MTTRLTRREQGIDALKAGLFFVAGALLLIIVPEVAVNWRGEPSTVSLWSQLGVLAFASLGETQRRARPLLGLAIATVALLTGIVVHGLSTVGVLIIFSDLLYCVEVHGSRRVSWGVAAGAGAVIVGVGALSLSADGGRAAIIAMLSLLPMLAIPVLWGLEVRRHRELASAERERAEQARHLAELDRAAAVAAERSRMARDLHDIIAGQLSAIAIQSEAALTVPNPDPAVLRRVLTAVRSNSVASLTEMRTMIGLLRADGAADGDPRTAPAGLDRLDTLLDAGRATGLTIVVDDRRPPEAAVPAAVDLAAFRIVQESLTNAAKHAPGSTVALSLRQEAGELVVELENELVAGAPLAGGTGTGLLGLRERAGAVGGRVEAGRHGPMWKVRAVLPVPAPVQVSR